MKFFRNIVPAAIAGLMIIQSVPVYGSSLVQVGTKPVSSSDAYGQGQNKTRPDLTVADATKKAIDHNESIKKSENAEEVSDEAYKDLQRAYNNAENSNAFFAAATNMLSFELSRSLNIKSIKAQKENVEYTILQTFNSILNAEKDLALYDEQIKISEKNIEINKIKLDLGMVSQTAFDTEKLKHDKLVESRATYQSSIDKAYVRLNQVMGQKLENRYNLILTLPEYQALENVNLTTYTSKFLSESLEVKQAEDDIQVAKYDMDTYETPVNFATSEILASDAGKIKKEQAYANAVRNKTNIQETLKKTVMDTYNSIKDLEISIKTQELDLENSKKQLEISKKQLELGQTTKFAVDKLEYSIQEKEAALEKSKNSHTIMVIAFKNPNLLSSSVGAGNNNQSAAPQPGDAESEAAM